MTDGMYKSILEERAADNARLSEARDYASDDGAVWKYSIVDGEFVRLIRLAEGAVNVTTPVEIEGMEVREMAADACAKLTSLETVKCSDSLRAIGNYAFRMCPNLREAELPDGMDAFNRYWFRGCSSLETLKLPGCLQELDGHMFDEFKPKHLIIGKNLKSLEPGMFARSTLQSIEVDPQNPYFVSDGTAIFTKDMKRMISLAVHCSSYSIPAGVEEIATKAAVGTVLLRTITFPNTLRLVGDFAFMKTGLEEVNLPDSVRAVGSHAFFRCPSLHAVSLHDGLESIGDLAFAGNSISNLRIPASVSFLGADFASNTSIRFSGATSGFSIEDGSDYRVDEHGGLYCLRDDGLHFSRMLDANITGYSIAEGTLFIDPDAFIRKEFIRSVELPDGLRVIGDAAFKSCHSLAHVNIP